MALRQQRANGARPQEAPKQNGSGNRPVYSKRYWTGSGSVEVAVFATPVDNGNASFTSYGTAAKRSYKDDQGKPS
jgi:hypothetical protein